VLLHDDTSASDFSAEDVEALFQGGAAAHRRGGLISVVVVLVTVGGGVLTSRVGFDTQTTTAAHIGVGSRVDRDGFAQSGDPRVCVSRTPVGSR